MKAKTSTRATVAKLIERRGIEKVVAAIEEAALASAYASIKEGDFEASDVFMKVADLLDEAYQLLTK